VVRVDTSDAGLFGFGCATFTQRAELVRVAIETYLAPLLVGRDPADIEDIHAAARLSSYWRGGPVLNSALSGVDMALWDILGRRSGMPVHELVGGQCREFVPLYAHASGRDVAEVRDAVGQWVEQGYRYVRCQVAARDGSGYGVVTAGRSSDTARFDAADYCTSVPALFEELRHTFGDVHLLHDVHERLEPPAAIRLARDLEPHKLYFLEDALALEDIGYYPTLRSATTTPLATGELFTSATDYLPLVSSRLIDHIRVHISAIGGFTPARKLAALCEHYGVATAWHGPGDVSPIGHAANLALDFAVPNFGVQEQHQFAEPTREVFPGCPEMTAGRVWPNALPGWGVDFDEKAAARYPCPPALALDAWTMSRRADGSLHRP
jgi:mannonate dehydratase